MRVVTEARGVMEAVEARSVIRVVTEARGVMRTGVKGCWCGSREGRWEWFKGRVIEWVWKLELRGKREGVW